MPNFTLVNINMKHLKLNINKIETIHPKAFWSSSLNNKTSHTRLEDLDLSNNKIEYIESGTFDPLINLIEINLRNNKIAKIEQNLFLKIAKLNHIFISTNKLTNLPTTWLPSTLTTLYIEYNNITRLSNETFHGAINLSKLVLSTHNIIIDTNTFTHLSKHTEIIVKQNKNVGIQACNCDYIWYLNITSNSKVCSTEDNKIRNYLRYNCIVSG